MYLNKKHITIVAPFLLIAMVILSCNLPFQHSPSLSSEPPTNDDTSFDAETGITPEIIELHPTEVELTTQAPGLSCPPYSADFKLIDVPDPLSGDNPTFPLQSRPEPEVSECYNDMSFGTSLQRVTAEDGVRARHEYSRFDPYNADQTLILLLEEDGGQTAYSTAHLPYNQEANRIAYISFGEPRWDPNDPDLLWGIQDFSVVQYRISTGELRTVKDFAQDSAVGPLIAEGTTYRITMKEEGEASIDRRWWALALQGNDQVDYRLQYIFTWDLQEELVMGLYPSGRPLRSEEAEIDWVGMSPLGNWVLIGGMHDNTGELIGLTMADKQLSHFYRLDYTTSHADVALDVNGEEVVVMQNYNTDTIDLIPLNTSVHPILEAGGSYEDSGHIPLLRLYYDSGSPFGLNSGVHISCNAPGLCLISTTIAPGAPEQNWLDRSIVLVMLDPNHPQVTYLAKLYNTTTEEPRLYWDETHGSITADGSAAVWVENWGKLAEEVQVFLIRITLP